MRIKRFFYHSIRLFLGFLFLSSGAGKFLGKSGLMGPGWLFEELAKYDLYLFAVFIATSQIMIGFCLLSRRWTTLGAIMAIPLILNIWIVVISLNWQGTPYVVGVFFLMNSYLLWHDYAKIKSIVAKIQDQNSHLNTYVLIGQLVSLALLIGGLCMTHFMPADMEWVYQLGGIGLFASVIIELLPWEKWIKS